MRPLIACAACRRHVDAHSIACPFCGAATTQRPQRIPALGPLTRAAIFAGAAACGSHPTSSATRPLLPATVDAAPDSESAPKHAGTLTGRIRRGDQPLANATVQALRLDNPKEQHTAIADADGRFSFGELAAGMYRISMAQEWRDVAVLEGVANTIDFIIPLETPERVPVAKPYGAPPARRRVV